MELKGVAEEEEGEEEEQDEEEEEGVVHLRMELLRVEVKMLPSQ